MPSKELTVTKPAGYPALMGDPGAFVAALRANVGAGGISPLDLNRVKIPAGGGKTWEVETLDGTEAFAELEGVIVYHRLARGYWPSREITGAPPQCTSPDSENATGDPGSMLGNHGAGACLVCPLAVFGTAKQDNGEPGRGQACKQMHQLFIVGPPEQGGGILPKVVNLPPTSLGVSRKFMLNLLNHGLPFYAVRVGVSLTPDKNADGKPFSRGAIRFIARLDDAELAAINAYRETVVPFLEGRPVTAADADEVDAA